MLNQKLFASERSLIQRPLVRKMLAVLVLIHLVTNPWYFLCSNNKKQEVSIIDQQLKDIKSELKNESIDSKMFSGEVTQKGKTALLKQMAEIE